MCWTQNSLLTLTSSFSSHRTAEADEFTNELLEIAKFVHAEGIHQPLALGLHRSDYMLHKQDDGSLVPLQIELNTVAAGFASLAGRISAMHEKLLQIAPPAASTEGLLPAYSALPADHKPNRPVVGMAQALADTHAAFKSTATAAEKLVTAHGV